MRAKGETALVGPLPILSDLDVKLVPNFGRLIDTVRTEVEKSVKVDVRVVVKAIAVSALGSGLPVVAASPDIGYAAVRVVDEMSKGVVDAIYCTVASGTAPKLLPPASLLDGPPSNRPVKDSWHILFEQSPPNDPPPSNDAEL